MDGTLALKKYDVLGRIKALEDAGSYVLPVASETTLGGVKIGDNLSIDEDGTLNAEAGGSSMHTYSTTEQEVGTWIDGRTIYERTYVLRENGVDKYTKGGISNTEYLIGLENVANVWVDKIQAFRTSSGSNLVDSRNISGEIITSFDLTTGGLYYYTTHTPSDISVVLQYTKNSVETKKRSKKG